MFSDGENARANEIEASLYTPNTVMYCFWPIERNNDFIDPRGDTLSAFLKQ
jgi:hypothetical protein